MGAVRGGRRDIAADPDTPEPTPRWWAYVLASTTGARTYVGCTRRPRQRLAQHNAELPGGARSTRAGRPWRLVGRCGPFAGRGEAQAAEYRLKRLAPALRMRVALERDRLRDGGVPEDEGAPRRTAVWRALRQAAALDPHARLIAARQGLALAVAGTVVAATWHDAMAVRLAPSAWVRAVSRGARPFVVPGAAASVDLVVLPPDEVSSPGRRARWIAEAIAAVSPRTGRAQRRR